MANLPSTEIGDIDLTKGGLYTALNQLIIYLNDTLGANGTIEGAKLTLGLDNVDNTSDLSKPISDDTQAALNGKQATLVSGTNIKTINGTSVLGAGNITVQATLVSGTNIKTINGTSVLGAGNINTPTVTLSSSVTSTSTTEGANSLAAKTAFDKGVEALSAANGAVTTSSVLNATAGASSEAVGTYALLMYDTGSGSPTPVFGGTSSASYLYKAYVENDGSAVAFTTADRPSGTWKAMSLPNKGGISLWLKIA